MVFEFLRNFLSFQCVEVVGGQLRQGEAAGLEQVPYSRDVPAYAKLDGEYHRDSFFKQYWS